MAAPLDRTWYNTLIDDDGSGTVGTIWNKGQIDGLLDTVDASLAGLVDTAGSYTQTGLTTFDRDPAAPFAVTPGSAVVPNLDADKVDGLHASALVKHTGANALQQIATFTTGDTITGSPTALLNGGHIELTSGSPQVTFHNSAAPANARRWGFYVDSGGGGILLMTMTDAGAGILWPFHIERSGLVNLHSVSLSSHIKFPGAQQQSADPNTLDDYREGVFTPFFKSTGGQSGQVYQGFTLAHYVKVGRTVTVSGRIALATLGTFNAGGISIGTLPFASSIQGAVAIGYCVGLAFSSGGVHGWINGAEINLTTWPAGGGTGIATFPNSWLTATTDIIFGCSYIANS